ncbi:MAG: alpha/beta hydrolase [Candidatus Hodarchaeota archaeon]
MSEQEKVSDVSWSPYLVRFIRLLLFILIAPHFLFWIPHWLQQIPNVDLGWQLNGLSYLPSLILNLLYAFFTACLFIWAIAGMGTFSRWPKKITSDILSFEDISIPVGGGKSLPGVLIKTPATPAKNAPVAVICHGLGGSKENFFPFGIPFGLLGFTVLFYDHRGHGATTFGRKWETLYIIKDFEKVVDWIEKRAEEKGDINAKDIVAFGGSLGGGVVLNEAYLDSRVKFIIAVCTWGDFQMTATRKLKNLWECIVKAGYEIMGMNLSPSNLQNRMVSPIYNSFNRRKGFFGHPIWYEVDNDYRVMLAHCTKDEVINFENFEMNRKYLNLPKENYIYFDGGNHAFAFMETALVGKFLLWFYMRGY